MTDQTEKPKNRGGRPRKPIDVTQPDIAAAIDAAVDKHVAALVDKIAAARGTEASVVTANDGDMKWMRQLALAIGEISDQGTSRKRIAPEILAKRAEARKRMEDMIVRTRESGASPEYRLTNQTYLDERLLQPYKLNAATKKPEPVEIIWDGVPNESMLPINDVAKEIYNLFMESIGGLTTVSDKTHDGRSFVPDSRPFSVTAGGLTVKGELNRRSMVGNLADSNQPRPNDRLKVIGQNDPRAEEVHVLGTVAAPARQNFAGEAKR